MGAEHVEQTNLEKPFFVVFMGFFIIIIIINRIALVIFLW